jgi:type III restriction enzyme
MAWLTANLDLDYFSHKQLRQIVRLVFQRLGRKNRGLPGKLALVKYEVLGRIRGLIQRQTDQQTEAAFKNLFNAKKLCFYLECRECCFEIPERFLTPVTRQLVDDHNVPVQRSLFDFVPDDLNEYERSVALFIDKHPEVLWWYRNLVGPENFSVQGYLRELIYPDFIVQKGKNRKPIAKVLVVESKGRHLSGNPDTNYKREMAGYFEEVGRKVSWQELGNGFENHQFQFQVIDEGEYQDRDWRDELGKLLEETDT